MSSDEPFQPLEPTVARRPGVEAKTAPERPAVSRDRGVATDAEAQAAPVEPTVRRALHELGTDPGTGLAQSAARTAAAPAFEPTVRRPVTDVGSASQAGDFGLDPTAVRGPREPATPARLGVVPTASADGAFEPTAVRAVSRDGDPLIGATLGEYRVIERLGSGGMGVVYRGEQPLIGRPVAVKVLRREYAKDPTWARRLLEEARAVAAARHPGIIDVLSFGETPGGEPYLVMEFLEGEGLDQRLAREGALPLKDALALLAPIAHALAAAHAVGVIHRDLKPANVLVATLRDGTTFPKLLDFGLARRGEVGASIRQTSVGGTPLYIAPEQARGEPVGPLTDLYSFGCMAFELLAGRPPFTASALSALIEQHLSLRPPSLREAAPDVPVELERLILSLLEKDPAQRPASALDVRTRLEAIRAALAVSSAPTRVQRAHAPARAAPAPVAPTAVQPALPGQSAARRPVGWIVGGAALFTLLGAFATAAVLRPAPVTDPREPLPAAVTPVVPPTARDAPRPQAQVVAAPVEPPAPVAPAAVNPVVRREGPAPKRAAKGSGAPTARDVKRRWKQLKQKIRTLPDDLARAAQLQLDEARQCTRPPEDCWLELSDIEQTFFPE